MITRSSIVNISKGNGDIMIISDAEEYAYHYALEQEYNEIMQESTFTNPQWDILMIMQNMGFVVEYKDLEFLRKVLRG